MEIKNAPDKNIVRINKCKTREYVRKLKNETYKTLKIKEK